MLEKKNKDKTDWSYFFPSRSKVPHSYPGKKKRRDFKGFKGRKLGSNAWMEKSAGVMRGL
jgi:hypothetical protein